ncbi:MAG: hypothetical protein ABSE36_04745 [Terracidiphilus sp.]|jgi:hypothetical protein
MKKLLEVVVLCGAAIVFLATCARSQQIVSVVGTKPAAEPDKDSVSLPPLPPGKTTILGGEIRNFDPVRDQFSLRIYGQRPMKILFDERTQVYRDGVRIPVRDLGFEDHASVQTTLDGASVFAVSIHILAGSQEGECEGRVLKYDRNTGELTVASSMSPAPVKLLVQANASIERLGEPGFEASQSGLSDLVPGSLISVSFESAAAHRNVATQIKVLAVPGAAFVFSGNVTYLDMHTGIMVLVDPRDGKSYQIRFDSASLPMSESLRTQANVTVTAIYDGTRYEANAITMN